MKLTATTIGMMLSAALLTGCPEKKEEPKPDTKAAATSDKKPAGDTKKADDKKADIKEEKKEGKEGSCGEGSCGSAKPKEHGKEGKDGGCGAGSCGG